MSATPQSVNESYAFLRRHVPRFDALRRAASWPGPVAWFLTSRRLPAAADPGGAIAALRLVHQDDRKFCRAVHLDGWRKVSTGDPAVFEVEADETMLWPVAVRALVLFGGAVAGATDETASKILIAPGDEATTSIDSDVQRFVVRTHVHGDGGFRVVVR